MDTRLFVLDANVFIQAAKSHYYAFDLAPGFWDSLVRYARDGRVGSVICVKGELDYPPELVAWADNDFANGFASTDDEDVVASYNEVITWVQNQEQYMAAAKSEFANVPDGWLIAYAKAKNFTVVTMEISEPGRRNKVKIPDVCNHFSVECIDLFEMMHRLQIKWT